MAAAVRFSAHIAATVRWLNPSCSVPSLLNASACCVHTCMDTHSVFFVCAMCGHVFSALWYLGVLVGLSVLPWIGLCTVSGLGLLGTARGFGDSQNAFLSFLSSDVYTAVICC